MLGVALEYDVDEEGDEGVGAFLLGREMTDEACVGRMDAVEVVGRTRKRKRRGR